MSNATNPLARADEAAPDVVGLARFAGRAAQFLLGIPLGVFQLGLLSVVAEIRSER
jgi:hypothetical protein